MGVNYVEVIGDPIGHSKSPLIHKFWLEKLGVEGDYRALRVTEAELPDYLESRRSDPDWLGCNLTMPLKRSVVPLLDRNTAAVQVTGAANTVLKVRAEAIGRATDGLVGNNTDLRGFAEPFREHHSERGKAALIGSGGAARAAYVALAALGFEIVYIANRTPEKAATMARSFGKRGLDIGPLDAPIPAVDLLVNASALGSRFAPGMVDLDQLPPNAIVYDIVYDPVETELLAAARRRGLRVIDGLTMLIGQAAASFVHFFDGEPPRRHDPELRERLER
ncbi:MAG TPA: shikimate dehydrogenase [Allosphingosinicella sp.]|nr:shikimate dehydrogenase [Allosphingosinicella sp.]